MIQFQPGRTHEEELISGVPVILCPKRLAYANVSRKNNPRRAYAYAIVAHQRLEVEAEFRVALDPAAYGPVRTSYIKRKSEWKRT